MIDKLESMMNRKSVSISEAITKIQNDGALLNDFVAPTAALNFSSNEKKLQVSGLGNDPLNFTDFALGQVADKLGVPVRYVRSLDNETAFKGSQDLLVNILNDHAANIKRDRVLVRTVDNNVRGFLSDSYRRLNSAGIFTAFLMAAQQQGAVLVDAYGGDSDFIEVVSPDIIEVPTAKNGIMYTVFGARLRNSNVGKAALQMNTFAINLICTNGITGTRVLREMHLGKRLPDNITLSQITMQKDTEAMASLVSDVMNQMFAPETIATHRNGFIKASEIEVDIVNEVQLLPKLGFTQSEADAVSKVFQNGNEDDGVQGAPTLLKLAQGMTAVARDLENKERSRTLEDLAGSMLLNRTK